MKTKFLFACSLLGLAILPASAQVAVEVTTDQDQFLQGESLQLAVKITNRSGQQLHLGADNDWLTFNVESYDGFVVTKNFEVPVKGDAFDLESSQQAVKRVDIAPSFDLSKIGRYKVTATLNVKDWSKQFAGKAKDFDIVSGAKLWAQDFGLPATNQAPEMRRYSLEQASYLRGQKRLYVQVSGQGGQIIGTHALGPSVSFGTPEALVDRYSMLHVVWQSGGQSFNYSLVNPDGQVLRGEVYNDYNNSRPHLLVDENGDIRVKGGVRRPQPGELPQVGPPPEVSSGTKK
jgi:hypothetical protein